MVRFLRGALFVFCACQPIGGTSGFVLNTTSQLCVETQTKRLTEVVTPLFPRAAAVNPIVSTRSDGVLVTTAAGRMHVSHETDSDFGTYPALAATNRTYSLTISDSVADGGTQIDIVVLPDGDVSTFGTDTQFRAWKQYGVAGNTNSYGFHFNSGMQKESLRRLTKSVDRNDREARPIHLGDVMEFEIHFYLAGTDAADPNPVGMGGNTVYYSDTFRYRVGRGGLSPENLDAFAPLGPAPSLVLGGDTSTSFMVAADALTQPALNLQPPHQLAFVTGRESESACTTCHVRNGRGSMAAPRIASPLIGLGLLEAIDDATLIALADEDDCNGDGISGRVSLVGTQIGRFGWKADQVSISNEVAAHAGPADSSLITYLQLLGVPPQVSSTSEQLFVSIGCAACHTPSLTVGSSHPNVELRGQTIRPYSDLLLHDFGDAEWRTAPLWGLRGSTHLLHDGRAATVLEAVLMHAGEAHKAREAFAALSDDQRATVLAFLDSL